MWMAILRNTRQAYQAGLAYKRLSVGRWGAQEFALELAFRDANNGLQRVTAKFRPAANEALDNMPQIGIPGFVPWKSKLPNYFFATVQMKATSTLDRMLDDVMLSGSRNRRLGSSSIGSGGSIGRWAAAMMHVQSHSLMGAARVIWLTKSAEEPATNSAEEPATMGVVGPHQHSFRRCGQDLI